MVNKGLIGVHLRSSAARKWFFRILLVLWQAKIFERNLHLLRLIILRSTPEALMKTAPRTSLTRLRAKTDRDLAILVRLELDRGFTLIRESRCSEAERRYRSAKTFLAVADVSAKERAALLEDLETLRRTLPRCAMSAA
jgi:hypothetical protein